MNTKEIRLEIPVYDEILGIQYYWESGFIIDINNSYDELSIRANKAGLISLAIQLLNLAQDTVPSGSHLHLDEYNSLEEGSKELVVEKMA